MQGGVQGRCRGRRVAAGCLDEVALHEGDDGDGEDRDDEELRLDGVHGRRV